VFPGFPQKAMLHADIICCAFTKIFNLVAAGVTQADIKNLETKLLVWYAYRLPQYKEEIVTLQVQLASVEFSWGREGFSTLREAF
jgi:hypothetical protein